MLEGEVKDKLQQTANIVNLHLQRLNYAKDNLQKFYPLTLSIYESFGNVEFSLFDQMIFRFSKMQDVMGQRFFPTLLILLGEDVAEKPFIDVLLLLEKINLLDNHKSWLQLRETRNFVTHEYPFNVEETVEGLNTLFEDCSLLEGIWQKHYLYIKSKFDII